MFICEHCHDEGLCILAHVYTARGPCQVCGRSVLVMKCGEETKEEINPRKLPPRVIK